MRVRPFRLLRAARTGGRPCLALGRGAGRLPPSPAFGVSASVPSRDVAVAGDFHGQSETPVGVGKG